MSSSTAALAGAIGLGIAFAIGAALIPGGAMFAPFAFSIGVGIGMWAFGGGGQSGQNGGSSRIQSPQMAAISQAQVTTATEGLPVCVIYGTARVAGNIIWYGNFRNEPVWCQSGGGGGGAGGGGGGGGGKGGDDGGGGGGGGSAGQPAPPPPPTLIGYRYYLSSEIAICFGEIDQIISIHTQQPKRIMSSTVYTNPGTGAPATIPMSNGTARFYFGSPNQSYDGTDGTNVAYRNTCYIAMPDFYIGASASMPSYSFTVKRIPKNTAMGSTKAEINGDANPAHIILDLLTNELYGRGIDVSVIDLPSFQAARDTLFSENFGLSFCFDRSRKMVDALADILQHIDGLITFTNGKFYLKLLRSVSPAGLPSFDGNSISSLSFDRPSWTQTANDIRLEFVDSSNEFQSGMVMAQDLANQQIRGDVVQEKVTFGGITKRSLAETVAWRVLKRRAYPAATIAGEANRDLMKLETGDAFVLTWPDLGISSAVFRMLKVTEDTLGSEKIKFTAIEDIFSLINSTIVSTSPPIWTPPDTTINKVIHWKFDEAPFVISGEHIGLITVASRDDKFASGYQLLHSIDSAGDYLSGSVIARFNPGGVLRTNMLAGSRDAVDDNTIRVEFYNGDASVIDTLTRATFLTRRNVAIIGGEIVCFQTITPVSTNVYDITGIWRGMYDTDPDAHAKDTTEFYYLGAMVLGAWYHNTFQKGQTIYGKVSPFDMRGAGPLSDPKNVTIVGRAIKPYPPDNLKINSDIAPWSRFSTDIVCDWIGRNKSSGAGHGLFNEYLLNPVPFTDGSFRLRFYNTAGNVLLRTVEISTDNPIESPIAQTYTYTEADHRADNGGNLADEVRVELEAYNGIYSSAARSVTTRKA